ncbi:TraR/DksA family transcriptional regulator [Streptacidiphilus neutrinimicus]|uniref:TraR/DksA family transcriptional regulator n=1 Tax=Streptacidiphilus neutrinimicus TaxID=105420 RepID=UPI0005A96D4A|nr:TraR/DksA C4-type zinc finger protein [Streptacidiphilus neutrinimicus]
MSHPSAKGRTSGPVPENVRDLLTRQQAEVGARIAALEGEYRAIVEANALVAVDDEHDPEGSSTAFERAHVAALLAQGRQEQEQLEQALKRLDDGTYGRCEACRAPIPAGRLEIRPAATHCVVCAEAAAHG